jgi:hypothetical protein
MASTVEDYRKQLEKFFRSLPVADQRAAMEDMLDQLQWRGWHIGKVDTTNPRYFSQDLMEKEMRENLKRALEGGYDPTDQTELEDLMGPLGYPENYHSLE